MGGQKKRQWNKQKAKVDNNGEENEEHNNDADKRATHIVASTKKRGLSAVVGMSASKRWDKPRRCPSSKRGEAVSTLGIDLSTHVGK